MRKLLMIGSIGLLVAAAAAANGFGAANKHQTAASPCAGFPQTLKSSAGTQWATTGVITWSNSTLVTPPPNYAHAFGGSKWVTSGSTFASVAYRQAFTAPGSGATLKLHGKLYADNGVTVNFGSAAARSSTTDPNAFKKPALHIAPPMKSTYDAASFGSGAYVYFTVTNQAGTIQGLDFSLKITCS